MAHINRTRHMSVRVITTSRVSKLESCCYVFGFVFDRMERVIHTPVFTKNRSASVFSQFVF